MNHPTLTLQLNLAEVLASSPKQEWRNIEKFMIFKVPQDNKIEILVSIFHINTFHINFLICFYCFILFYFIINIK